MPCPHLAAGAGITYGLASFSCCETIMSLSFAEQGSRNREREDWPTSATEGQRGDGDIVGIIRSSDGKLNSICYIMQIPGLRHGGLIRSWSLCFPLASGNSPGVQPLARCPVRNSRVFRNRQPRYPARFDRANFPIFQSRLIGHEINACHNRAINFHRDEGNFSRLETASGVSKIREIEE